MGSSSSDLSQYRSGYPGQEDRLDLDDNYRFYSNEMASQPEGDLIDNIHTRWWGDSDRLEAHHGYVQWLFPIREHGMNYKSQPLQKHEIEKMKSSPEIMARLRKSYELMLDFYGSRLTDADTGTLEKHPEKWQKQFKNLQTHTHNYLRITRILKCLGEFGMENYQKNFLEFYIKLIYVPDENGNVWLSNCQSSCENYWVGTIKNDQLRDEFEQKVIKLKQTYNPNSIHLKNQVDRFREKSFKPSYYDDESETENEWEDDEKIPDEVKRELANQMLEDEDYDVNLHQDDDDGLPFNHDKLKDLKEDEDEAGSKGADVDQEPDKD